MTTDCLQLSDKPPYRFDWFKQPITNFHQLFPTSQYARRRKPRASHVGTYSKSTQEFRSTCVVRSNNEKQQQAHSHHCNSILQRTAQCRIYMTARTGEGNATTRLHRFETALVLTTQVQRLALDCLSRFKMPDYALKAGKVSPSSAHPLPVLSRSPSHRLPRPS